MFVDSGGIALAVTDHGGNGSPVLLTHGFGGDQSNLAPLVRRLVATFRVVTFDMRNHGASGDGPWTWDATVADFQAVRDAFGIVRPVVGGHSLGGMVAEMFAAAHPDTSAAFNIDGHGRGKPEQYVGLAATDVHDRHQRLVDWQVTMTPTDPPPRPSLEEMLAITPLLDALDMFAVHQAVPCPLLIFNAYGDDPIGGLPGMEWVAELLRAYRTGLSVDLDALAAQRPNVRIAPVDATHYLIFSHADFVAEQIAEFARSL